MRQFIRNNPTIVFGLGFPLLIVAVFAVIHNMSAALVSPPQYEVVFAIDYDSNFRIEIENKKAQLKFYGNNIDYIRLPRIFQYNPKTKTAKEMFLSLPKELSNMNDSDRKFRVVKIEVPELESLTLDNSTNSPDGYQFKIGEYSNSGVLTSFYSRRYHDDMMLVKNGFSHRISDLANVDYWNRAQFIGWVIPQ